MSGHGERLSRQQEQAIATLLACPNFSEAARRLSIHPNTLRHWFKTSAGFREAYAQARKDLLGNAVAKLQTALHDSVDELVRKLAHPDPEVSLRAAELLLNAGLKGSEVLDLAAKVAQLEAKATG